MEKKLKKHNNTLSVLVVLAMVLAAIAIAYAILSTTLNINFGTVNSNALTWNVGFQPMTSVGIHQGGTTSTICGNAEVTTTVATLESITLNALNDKCVYKLKVLNTGGVPAKLSSIVSKTPNNKACNTTQSGNMVCGNISYKLTSDESGNSILGIGTVVPPITGEMTLYLVAEYTGTEIGVAEAQTGAGFSLNYVQP